MDPGVFSVAAILVGIFLATAVFIWQMNSQSNRLESKIETQGRELRAEIRELRAEMVSQVRELSAKIESQGRELSAKIEAQGRRVSDSELEQARLDGVNSVLMNQTHTHQPAAD